MEKVSTITQHLCRLTLMWVMLLWAFTLPGQEVAVYNFLLTGSGSLIASAPHPETKNNPVRVKAQEVTAFPDARPSCTVSPVLQKAGPALSSFLAVFFTPPADTPLPRQALMFATPGLLAQRLPVSIQPNAP